MERLEELGREAMLQSQPTRAAVYLAEAYKMGNDKRTLRIMLEQAMRSVDMLSTVHTDDADGYTEAVFSDDGTRLLASTKTGAIAVWRADNGQTLLRLAAEPQSARHARFLPGGREIALLYEDGRVVVLEARSGKLVRSGQAPAGFVPGRDPAHPYLAVYRKSGELGPYAQVMVYDLQNLKPLRTITQPCTVALSPISPDGKTVVFTYKGDLWKVSSEGGNATPLTLHEAHDFMPVWSRDGKTICFASDRFGNFDLFSIPVEGGEARRLTFHSANEYPYDYSIDDKTIVFGSARMDLASNRQYPTGSQPELYQVSVNGGKVSMLLPTPAEDVKHNKDGSKLLYHDKKGGENTWRKHHTSSIARDLWVYDSKTQKHTKLTTFNGEDRNPIFADNDKSVVYLSEANGSFNVHKFALDNPTKVEALTSFKKHPVRFLSQAKDGTLCFSYAGNLYTMAPKAKPKQLNVNIATDARRNNEQIVPVSAGARDLAVSSNGKEVAFVFRGEVFVTSVEGGVPKRSNNMPEQERS
mgnify:CR=1 FL=1